MQDLLSMLNALHRPALMMRAARIGAEDYRRAAHLPRLLGYGMMPRAAVAVVKLMEMEAELEDQRRGGNANYSIMRHLDILIALISEARELRSLSGTAPARAIT